MSTIPIKRALISVSDKKNIIEFASHLNELGVDLISTGGTSLKLEEAGIAHRRIEALTGFPEILDGRVKTLHPHIHGGILAKRDVHQEEMANHQIEGIDLVIVNFYPFLKSSLNEDESETIENIDIGGPTLARAAAKNFKWVGAVVDPCDYPVIIEELRSKQGLTFETRLHLAEKVFSLTSQYDASIHQYFMKKQQGEELDFRPHFNLPLEKSFELRYGENPHQRAFAYRMSGADKGLLSAHQHQGKMLSYNNLLDAESAWSCVSEFSVPACVIVKHANPCGAATADTITNAYLAAFKADSMAAFGGIVALNQTCTKEIAEAMTSCFMEVVLAPHYTDDALEILASKPQLRILAMPLKHAEKWEMRSITGAMLIQEKDAKTIEASELKCVTKRQPNQKEMTTMLFAWRVLKHIKSNGILIAEGETTMGIGAGQVSRIDAVEIALRKAQDKIKNAILASDAFFPFRDSIDRLQNKGISAIIQPGGSIRDNEVIAACNEHGYAMVFTGRRCFRH